MEHCVAKVTYYFVTKIIIITCLGSLCGSLKQSLLRYIPFDLVSLTVTI